MSRVIKSIKIPSVERDAILKIFPKGIIALDLETTGLSPLTEKIIEVAAIKLTKSGATQFHTLVNPQIEIPQYTIDIHGITNAMVKDAPTYNQIVAEFVDFVGELPIVAHGAQFDIGFIVKENFHQDFDLKINQVFDSCQYAKQILKKSDNAPENFKLSTLAEYFKIPLNHHQASDDALASLRILANSMLANEFRLRPREVMNFSKFKKFKLDEVTEQIQEISEMIKTKQNTFIKYKGSSSGNGFRPIRPIAFIPMPKGVVLYAQCLLTNLNKSFIVKKITDHDPNPPIELRVSNENE